MSSVLVQGSDPVLRDREVQCVVRGAECVDDPRGGRAVREDEPEIARGLR